MPLDKARHGGIHTQSMVNTSTLCAKVSEKSKNERRMSMQVIGHMALYAI